MNLEELKEKLNDLLIELDEIPLHGLKPGTFEWALVQMKSGKMPKRRYWINNLISNRFIMSSFPTRFLCRENLSTGEKEFYTPSQADIFAEDWEI